MGRRDVVDPAGISWTVRRRWYAWPRLLSFRELVGNAARTGGSDDAQPATDAAVESSEDSDLPRNWVLRVLAVVLGLILWAAIGAGKLIFYTAVVLLFAVLSIGELTLQLAAMPVAVLLRSVGLARWPVEIGRSGERFGTEHARDFAAAAALRDDVAERIERGELPTAERTADVAA